MRISDPAPAFELRALHVISDGTGRGAAMQMALDEALLESAEAPTLRFYRWERPSLSFGYFGRYAAVAAEVPQRDVVRRWTGGGIVLHGSDITYGLVVPETSLTRRIPARAVYSFVHAAMARALAADPAVELAAADAPKVSDACFANPVTADVLASGRKIAGAAQRRTRAGLLQQGSIQYEQLRPAFAKEFAMALCGAAEAAELADDVIARATLLAATKYRTAEWLHRR